MLKVHFTFQQMQIFLDFFPSLLITPQAIQTASIHFNRLLPSSGRLRHNQPDTLNLGFLRNIFKLYTRFTSTLLGRGLLMKDSSKYGTAMTASTPR